MSTVVLLFLILLHGIQWIYLLLWILNLNLWVCASRNQRWKGAFSRFCLHPFVSHFAKPTACCTSRNVVCLCSDETSCTFVRVVYLIVATALERSILIVTKFSCHYSTHTPQHKRNKEHFVPQATSERNLIATKNTCSSCIDVIDIKTNCVVPR